MSKHAKTKPSEKNELTPQYRWQERNPVARWAHRALESALKKGIITKQPCAVCGSPDAEAHHDDYHQPLKTVWLCRAHHKRHHAEINRVKGIKPRPPIRTAGRVPKARSTAQTGPSA